MSPGTAKKNKHTLVADNHQTVAELFHELIQPLTTLHCCLELSLKKMPRSTKTRRDLRIALQQTEKIANLIAELRELVDRANTPDPRHNSSAEDFAEPAPPLAYASRYCG
jgi:signal transduction histidine kinase